MDDLDDISLTPAFELKRGQNLIEEIQQLRDRHAQILHVEPGIDPEGTLNVLLMMRMTPLERLTLSLSEGKRRAALRKKED